MKKLVVFIFVMFNCIASATTMNLDWIADGNTYAQTSCETGTDLIIPTTPPTKRGHRFLGWRNVAYIQLDYIESTGTQYIPSGISFAKGDHLRLLTDMQYTTLSGSQFFGIYAGAYIGAGGQYWAIGGTPKGNADTQRHVFDLNTSIGDIEELTLKVDETVYKETRDVAAGNVVLLNLQGGFFCSAKLYSAKIYRNNSLVFDGVPCKNSQGIIGLCDLVSTRFLTNAGTGNFIAGPISANQTLE